MADRGHTCHALGCEVPVPPRLHMCIAHWRMVPRDKQRALLANYRRGQERDMQPSPAYLRAAADCVAAVARKEGYSDEGRAFGDPRVRDVGRDVGGRVVTLFNIPVTIKPPGETRDRRLTRRNREKLAGGVHPATHRALFIGTGETCGDCEHGNNYGYHNRSYWKCAKHRLGESHSAASDIRRGWPACVLFEPRVAS